MVKVWLPSPSITALNPCTKSVGGDINTDSVSSLEQVLALMAGASLSSVKFTVMWLQTTSCDAV